MMSYSDKVDAVVRLRELGAVHICVGDVKVAFPEPEAEGSMWLEGAQEDSEHEAAEALEEEAQKRWESEQYYSSGGR